jgi:hypothetical protein
MEGGGMADDGWTTATDRGYTPHGGRAPFAVVCMYIWMAAGVISTGALLNRSNVLQRIADGDAVTQSEADRADNFVVGTGLVVGAAELLALIALLLWFVRAYRNVEPLGGERKHGVAQAVWTWFVPILNLFRPYEIAREIVSGVPDAPRRLIGWWWATWIAAGVISVGAAVGALSAASDPSELAHRDLSAAARDAAGVVVAILSVLVIRRVTRAQEHAATTTMPAAETWAG